VRSLRTTKSVNVLVSSLGAVLAVAAMFSFRPTALSLLLGAAACFGAAVVSAAPQFAFFRGARGPGFAVKTVALELLNYLVSGVAVLFGWVAHQAVGEPRPAPATEAFAELEVKRWPPVPIKRMRNTARPTAAAQEPEDVVPVAPIAPLVHDGPPLLALPIVVDSAPEADDAAAIETPAMLDVSALIDLGDTRPEAPLQ
jgi:hypothetical protein